MKTIASLLFCAAALGAAPRAASAADHVGQIRAFALAPGNSEAVDALHREGWLEARGQRLPVHEFQSLYKTLGRAWTADGTREDRFGIPDLRDRSQRSVSSDNPFGVLGPGDLVTSGHATRSGLRAGPVSYWIFAGQDVSGVSGN